MGEWLRNLQNEPQDVVIIGLGAGLHTGNCLGYRQNDCNLVGLPGHWARPNAGPAAGDGDDWPGQSNSDV